jgi:putative flavoprotein involved in K+ transport
MIRGLVEQRGLEMLAVADPEPFDTGSPEEIDLDGFGAVLFTGGFRPGYASWVQAPGAFDELGFPIHTDGQSDVAPGLYFVGTHFLRKRKSSLLCGVGEDAAIVANGIVSAR